MKFHTGDVSLDNAPWSGRPSEVDGDQIETLIENNQHYITWEIANILKISKSIKLFLKMKNVSFILWKKLNELFGQPNIKCQKESTGEYLGKCEVNKDLSNRLLRFINRRK